MKSLLHPFPPSLGIALAVLVLQGCSVVTGLGPVTASNRSSQSVVIKLATIDGAWLLAPGQRVTMMNSHSPAINRGFLLSPTTCATIDTAAFPDSGSVHMSIGAGPSFTAVDNVEQPDVAPPVAPVSSLCP